MSLFRDLEERQRRAQLPLAARMRPRSLDEFVGQEEFLGEGKLLRRMLLAHRITSVIFYGPPGTGKTTLAYLVAQHVKARFVELNAAGCGVKEVRQVLDRARDLIDTDGIRTLLFLDEIHHFNRVQQDILLNDVENGTVVLIGATTQNPFFALNSPLVSRSQIFQFKPLTIDQILALLKRALADAERGFGNRAVTIAEDALAHWAVTSDGDARRALTALEIAVASFPADQPIQIDKRVAEDSIQRKAIVYDAAGDEHYDLASALIKSIRGSDPDAAIYWLARMLEGGEDPRFIVRRLIILASEDIGCADPMSLVVAITALHAAEFVGLPECQLNLAQAVIHLAAAPKSNASAKAIWSARKDAAEGRTVAVPPPLRDASYRGADRLGHGQGYQYAHDFPDAVAPMDYLPAAVQYYHPTDRGYEATIREQLQRIRQRAKPDADRATGADRNAPNS
jgi:putative ATPase